MTVLAAGIACLGVMFGFITYRTLIRTTGQASINDLTIVIEALGGGVAAAIVHRQADLGWYGIGLLGGFVAYGLLYLKFNKGKEFAAVMCMSPEIQPETKRDPNAPRAT